MSLSKQYSLRAIEGLPLRARLSRAFERKPSVFLPPSSPLHPTALVES